MSGCGVVYVELGERPDLDRLRRCGRWPCLEHFTQLLWVKADPHRRHAYAAQVAAFERQQHGGQVEQGSLV